MKKNTFLTLSLLMATSTMIINCGSGSSGTSQQYTSINVPTTEYSDSASQHKFAIYTSAASGQQTLTEIDTGSDFYVIESSYVGSNIIMTNQTITLYYDHGDTVRSGTLGYTYVTYLNQDGESIISTNNQVPVVVVPDGQISSKPNLNHAIMGMRLNSNLSARLFLAYPYNQMFILSTPESQLTFGNFTSQQLESFGTTQLVQLTCQNLNAYSSATNTCWNDMALQVKYTTVDNGHPVESTLNTLFDSGASSNFQFIPLPSWLHVNNNKVTNTIIASLPTNSQDFVIPLNTPIAAVESDYNGGIVNAGNNLFNYYSVLYNQQNGQIGLKKIRDF